MEKIITVRSKKNAIQFACVLPWACISISSYADEFPILDETNRRDLLQLAFKDIISPHYRNHPEIGKTYFSREQAIQVLDFVFENWDSVDCFMIHCEAGVSRSAAVAAAIENIFYGNDDQYFNSNIYDPNKHVYNLIIEVYNNHEKYGEVRNKLGYCQARNI